MLNQFELTTSINANTNLKFIEANAPFYSKLILYQDGKIISDCSFKPEEKNLVIKNMHNSVALTNALKKLNSKINDEYLSDFISLIDHCRIDQTHPNLK